MIQDHISTNSRSINSLEQKSLDISEKTNSLLKAISNQQNETYTNLEIKLETIEESISKTIKNSVSTMVTTSKFKPKKNRKRF